MVVFLQALAALALALLAVGAGVVSVATLRLVRLRWQTMSSLPLAHADIPATVRAVLDHGAAPLVELGFRYCGSGSATSAVADLPTPSLQYYDVYDHPLGHTHAMVTTPSVPHPEHASQLQLITCLTNGNNWTTLNGTRHLAPFDFPRWPVFDDYLPAWKDAWQRHLERVQFAQGRICTDSQEVQRRIALAFDKLVPALVQQGKLVPAGAADRWRFSLATALGMAFGMLGGSLRSAWARRGQRPSVQAADASVLRENPARTRSKWSVLAISALLFLAGVVAYNTPYLGQALTVLAHDPRLIPDDVTPDPAPTGSNAPTDWLGQVTQAGNRTPDDQLAIYLGAARQAQDGEDLDTALRHYLSAWTLAQTLPVRDSRRIDALEGLADLAEDSAQRRAYLQHIITELAQPVGAERIRMARAKEQLSADEPDAQQQVALLREALQLRKVGLGTDEALSQTRLLLARALDATDAVTEAEDLLRARVLELGLPSVQDRSRAALQLRVQRVMAQVDLIWFLLAHQRWQDAQRATDYAEHLLPATATVSWIHPQTLVREAALWTLLLSNQTAGLGARWDAYAAARSAAWTRTGKVLVHELDRALVAQALRNPTMYDQAVDAMRAIHAERPGASAVLCQARTQAPGDWRWRQSTLRASMLTEITRCQLPAPGTNVTR